jgi:hypothetical protein
MFVPEQFGNPVTCVMHGQAYLAETSIGQEIGQDERVENRVRQERVRREDGRVAPVN